MQLTTVQKRYASVLAVCLLAFLADRLFLSPGEASANDESLAPAQLAIPAAVQETMQNDTVVTRSTLSASLAWLADEHELDPRSAKDAFRAPETWLPEPEDGHTGPIVTDDPAARFQERHKLTAVMANGALGYAIVDGKRLRIGETLDGYRLVEVRVRSIFLEGRDEATVELKLPRRKLGPAPKKPDKPAPSKAKPKSDEASAADKEATEDKSTPKGKP